MQNVLYMIASGISRGIFDKTHSFEKQQPGRSSPLQLIFAPNDATLCILTMRILADTPPDGSASEVTVSVDPADIKYFTAEAAETVSPVLALYDNGRLTGLTMAKISECQPVWLRHPSPSGPTEFSMLARFLCLAVIRHCRCVHLFSLISSPPNKNEAEHPEMLRFLLYPRFGISRRRRWPRSPPGRPWADGPPGPRCGQGDRR